MVSWASIVTFGVALAGMAASVHAQSIYSCTDAKGRRITSDRPIGRMPGPRAARAVHHRHRQAHRQARHDGRRGAAAGGAPTRPRPRNSRARPRKSGATVRCSRATRTRPRTTRSAPDALAQIDEVIKAANKRSAELADQRKQINVEMEFYKKDPAKAPPSIKRRIEENEHSQGVQQRFIVDQEQEKARVRQRFDEEQVKLRELWTLVTPASAGGSAAAAKSTKK